MTEKNHSNYIIIFAPVVISLFAFFVSVKSCSNSNEALDLSRKQAKPFMQVVDVKLVSPVDKSTFITLDLYIKNLGQIVANDVSAEMDYCVSSSGPSLNCKGNSTTRVEVGDIGQSFEKTIRLKSNRYNREKWKNGNYRNYETGYFFGTIFFTDKTTNLEYKVDWCYELPLKPDFNIDSLILNPSPRNTFESGYEIEKQ